MKTNKNIRSLFLRLAYYSKLFAFWLVTIFVVGEIGVRCFCDPIPGIVSCVIEVEDERHYILKPNNVIHFEGLYEKLEKPVIWKTNEFGERVRENPLKFTSTFSDKIKIATYGDSESFGWGLSTEETYQQQLENMDSRIQAHNFGVPGYNVYQIAEHVEKTGHLRNPDLLLYLVNENDFDISFAFKQFPKRSELLKRLVFVSYFFKEKEAKKIRHSPEVKKRFAEELVKMQNYCEANEIEFIVAFLNWDNSQVLKMKAELEEYFLDADALPNKNVINCSSVHGLPEIDKHYTKHGHKKLAKLILTHLYENNYLVPKKSMD